MTPNKSELKCNPPSPPSTAADVRPDIHGITAKTVAAAITAKASVEKKVRTARIMAVVPAIEKRNRRGVWMYANLRLSFCG